MIQGYVAVYCTAVVNVLSMLGLDLGHLTSVSEYNPNHNQELDVVHFLDPLLISFSFHSFANPSLLIAEVEGLQRLFLSRLVFICD